MLKNQKHCFSGLKEVAAETGDQVSFVTRTSQTRTSRNTEGLTSTAAYVLTVEKAAEADSFEAASECGRKYYGKSEIGGERQSGSRDNSKCRGICLSGSEDQSDLKTR